MVCCYSWRIELLRHGVCGLIFIHALEREMGIANTGNHLAYSEMYFWESRFHTYQGKDFFQIQGFQGSGGIASGCGVVGFFSHREFNHMEICSPQALSLLDVIVLICHF